MNPLLQSFEVLSRQVRVLVDAVPSFRWATVTQVEPLRVHVDGDAEPLGVSPVCVGHGVSVGARALVLFYARRVVVLGVSSSGGVVGGVPVGVVCAFHGVSAPPGWLLCDGGTYAKADYPVLAAVLGAHGSGASFSVPDLRGRVPLGAGVPSANTDNSWGVIQSPGVFMLGKRVGEYKHVLSKDELAAHNHGVFGTGGRWASGAGIYASNVGAGSGWEIVSNWTSNANYLDTKTVGASKPHNNVQPALVVNFIIKA